VGLRTFRVMLDGADVAAKGNADGDRQRNARAVPVLGYVADDLLESRIDETVELDLRNRPEAAQGQADRDTDDRRFCQRRVEDALLAELLLQAVRDPKDAAQRTYVLAKDENVLVARQGIAQREVDRLGHRHRLHQDPHKEAANSSRSWRNDSAGFD